MLIRIGWFLFLQLYLINEAVKSIEHFDSFLFGFIVKMI